MKKTAICYLLFAFYGGHAVAAAFPEPAPTVASQSGLIQNVQNYSTSPFYNPSGPYNQRMPSPVYVQGTSLTAAECQSVVSVFVAAECGRMNNCANVRLSDIRPGVITQLSKLSGHNYVTACGGFIDAAFDEYIATNAGGVRRTGFPTPVGAANTGANFEITNPYEYKHPKWGTDEWYQDYVNRTKQLGAAQAQNNIGQEQLIVANFPTTAADLSFADRMANERAGYEHWSNTSAYRQLDVDDRTDVLARQKQEEETRNQIEMAQQRHQTQVAEIERQRLYDENPVEYCKDNPTYTKCKDKPCTDDQNDDKEVAHGAYATCKVGEQTGQRKCNNGAFERCEIAQRGGGGSGFSGGNGGDDSEVEELVFEVIAE